jgi:lipopolysaccharide/colanic/teichoic acid biosynthesis glycosyltransferase
VRLGEERILRQMSEPRAHQVHEGTHNTRAAGALLSRWAKRLLDLTAAMALLLVLLPLILAVAVAIKLDSRGPAFYRCRRIGFRGREFAMMKFRKMVDDAAGGALTAPEDDRFTRLGRVLAKTKLDEIPQLWNVVKGEMSLVGPRPEDPGFVELRPDEYEHILEVKPGITGLSQLAFARESEILDPDDRHGHYVDRLLPAKAHIDRMYALRRSLWMDLKILFWTAAAVLLRLEVAVHRETGRLTRRQPRVALETQGARQVVTTS